MQGLAKLPGSTGAGIFKQGDIFLHNLVEVSLISDTACTPNENNVWCPVPQLVGTSHNHGNNEYFEEIPPLEIS